ncbi:uncharacterized protein LOC126897413 [Daktulosphaira vitifoliae]|uniref:uncharacterized protein LOC126897413 n=1 Tax=Daktulosphaira vitifoliae TaxID=58002 RepID=UPI0021A9B568|nr:uncharacterized protein LOC126897413 [Daktulosphaira vitifoliae]
MQKCVDAEGRLFEDCMICLLKLKVNDYKLPCCFKTLHRKCLDKWLNNGVIKCPHCQGNPLEGVRICFKCRQPKRDDELVNKKCCKNDICKKCVNMMKTKCFCKEYLMKSIIFEPNRLCTECASHQGKYSYSSRCPQIYCEKCFKNLCKINNGCCTYCGEELAKKSFPFSFFKF